VGSITIKKSLALLFLACGVALAVSNVVLARRVSKLQHLDDLINTSNRLQPGTSVPPLVGYDISGKKVTYTFADDSRETVMLIFSPGCHACDENWPRWTRLIKGVNNRSTRLVLANVSTGASLNADYLVKHEIGGLPLVAEVSPESLMAYRMNYTPQTVLIGRDGKVLKVQTGALTDSDFALRPDCSPDSHANCTANGAVASLSN
jgi:hypothetical protein